MTENTDYIFYIKRKLAVSTQKFAVCQVSGGPYCCSNVNCGTETCVGNFKFYMVTCDNFEQSRIHCLF